MKKYNFNNTTYTEKELVKIAKEKGKETFINEITFTIN